MFESSPLSVTSRVVSVRTLSVTVGSGSRLVPELREVETRPALLSSVSGSGSCQHLRLSPAALEEGPAAVSGLGGLPPAALWFGPCGARRRCVYDRGGR